MCAIAREANIAARAPNVPSDQVRRPFHDLAGKITPYNPWKSRIRKKSANVGDVTGIDAGRFHLYPHFAISPWRGSDIHYFDNIGRFTKFTDLNGLQLRCSPCVGSRQKMNRVLFHTGRGTNIKMRWAAKRFVITKLRAPSDISRFGNVAD